MSDKPYDLELKGLDQIIKALKIKAPSIHVGILSDKATRSKSGKATANNAEIGSFHEFGTSTIPMRSFLRVPLSNKLEVEMIKSNALDKNVLKKVIKEGTLIPWMEKIAILAEGIVLGAFDSGGYGEWKGWKDSSYSNNTGQLLVDTQQLRNSITSKVIP